MGEKSTCKNSSQTPNYKHLITNSLMPVLQAQHPPNTTPNLTPSHKNRGMNSNTNSHRQNQPTHWTIYHTNQWNTYKPHQSLPDNHDLISDYKSMSFTTFGKVSSHQGRVQFEHWTQTVDWCFHLKKEVTCETMRMYFRSSLTFTDFPMTCATSFSRSFFSYSKGDSLGESPYTDRSTSNPQGEREHLSVEECVSPLPQIPQSSCNWF